MKVDQYGDLLTEENLQAAGYWLTEPLFHLSWSECRQKEYNNVYPLQSSVREVNDLKVIAQFDHTAGFFRHGERSKDNFRGANCVILDCDNTHSEDPNDWKTPEDVAEVFPVRFFVVYSRNNMKAKGNKAPRPKFHCYFKIRKVTTPEAFERKTHLIYSVFPWFDKNALDCARFIFGVEDPTVIEMNKEVR